MNANGYRIQRLDQKTDLITTTRGPGVEPFPARSWNEPLPIAVEGTPVQLNGEPKTETKSLSRFYPPLLCLSTALTGVFLFLYLTKPVIVREQAPEIAGRNSVAAVEAVSVAEEGSRSQVSELSPWPESDLLSSDSLPGFESSAPFVSEEEDASFLTTTLGVEKIVKVESLNGEMEEFTVSLPVLYPADMLTWDQQSITEAQTLAEDIANHLTKVREVQANGVRLLENWNYLVSKSIPQSVLVGEKALGLSQ